MEVLMNTKYRLVFLLLAALCCQSCNTPSTRRIPLPLASQAIDYPAQMVGVATNGVQIVQYVHVYSANDLKKPAFIVPAGSALRILDSTDGATKVQFLTEAWTSDYKGVVKQADAIGWISTDKIVSVKKPFNYAEQSSSTPAGAGL
jgi:hypothetical protein